MLSEPYIPQVFTPPGLSERVDRTFIKGRNSFQNVSFSIDRRHSQNSSPEHPLKSFQ